MFWVLIQRPSSYPNFHHIHSLCHFLTPGKPIGQAWCVPCRSPPSHISGNAQALNLRSFIPTPLESLEELKPMAFKGLGFQSNQHPPVEQLQAKHTHRILSIHL